MTGLKRPVSAAPGAGVDAVGNPVIDPTANVIALSEAAAKRQDDLRAADAKFNEAAVNHVKELSLVRSNHARDISDLRASMTQITAENLRIQQSVIMVGLNDRIAALEKSSYMGAGTRTGSAAAVGLMITVGLLAIGVIGLIFTIVGGKS